MDFCGFWRELEVFVLKNHHGLEVKLWSSLDTWIRYKFEETRNFWRPQEDSLKFGEPVDCNWAPGRPSQRNSRYFLLENCVRFDTIVVVVMWPEVSPWLTISAILDCLRSPFEVCPTIARRVYGKQVPSSTRFLVHFWWNRTILDGPLAIVDVPRSPWKA